MISRVEKKLGVILQYIQMALSILISFIYTPVMLRILGQSEYGIYNLSNSIISYLSLLSLGFGASYIRFYSRYKIKDDKAGINKLNGLFLSVFLVMGAVAFICGLALAANVSLFFNNTYSENDMGIAKILMMFMSFNLALSFPTSVFTSYVTSQEKFVFQKLLNMIKTVVSPFLTLPVLLLGFGSIGMVVITTIITVLVDIANIVFCISKLGMEFDFHKPNFSLLKEITTFSFFIAINQIVDQINWATDKMVLGKICTSSAVAVYAIGSQINTYYLQFSSAISGVFVPQVNRIVVSNEDEKKKNRQLTELFTKVGRVQFIILILILTGFIFFGKYFVLKWAGDEYVNSYYVALLLITPVTIPLIQNLGLEIQRAKNMHQFRSYVYLGMAILNVGISIVLSMKWGELGAASGTTISLLVANGVIMNWFYHQRIGIDIIYFWKNIAKFIPALVAPVVSGVLLNLKECTSLSGFAIRVVIYIGVYCISMYCLGMNEFEKQQVEKILQKVGVHK
ncbi:polysaccharide biosynthesis protein [Clostridiaceae bacterium AF31-3BH]|nr:polysaccharide biosynthesis protein [Clostridiaceae bacterium AF31-3BH]